MLLGTGDDLWADLFRKFEALLRLAPWKWLGERDSFAIHPAGYDEPFFVHSGDAASDGRRGFALIRGWNGDALYRQIREGAPHAKTLSYEIPFVLCTLREEGALTEIERTILATAGAKRAVGGEAPVFVSFRPGWLPWHLGRAEVVSSAKVLDQALGVLLRCETDRGIVYTPRPDRIWVRRQDGETQKWEEGWAALRPFSDPDRDRPMEVPDASVEAALRLPDDMPPVGIACDVIPKIALLGADDVRLRGEDGRIPLGYFFAICPYGGEGRAEAPPGGPLENGVYYPGDDLGSLRRFFPNTLVKFFLSKGRRPREVVVSSPRMMDILRPLQFRIPFKMTFHEKIPCYDTFHALVSKTVAGRVK